MKNKGCMQRWFLKWIAAMLMAMLLTQLGAVLPLPGSGLQMVHAAAWVRSWTDLRAAIKAGETEITLDSNFAYDGTSIEIPSGADITIKGSHTIFSSDQSSYDSMFKVKKDGTLTIDSGVTLSAKIGETSQTCPEPGSNATYTKDSFTGNLNNPNNPTDYEPKGFFIHVEAGGTANLKGTVSDFITSRDKTNSPRYVAPIVANGRNAVFNLDGGTIKNNLVGYIVDDSQANKDAQSIKQYVKGAGPNVPRVPQASVQKENKASFDRPRNKDAGIDGGLPGTGITATAGAIIYKGGAQGTIKDGTITNNRADTGGVMVSGEGTVVNMKSGTISKNVGVQFGGGSTAEQGGSIEMTGGNMEYNVAWFGGGAVYATENGVAWLLGLMNGEDRLHPQFDARLDGKFLMNGGSLNNNTALTRGGAILADSDAVDVKKGALKDNMSRMLGGAVYVMGDHPKYTYTMYLTGLYVHDNVAVSGLEQARQSAANGPSSMYTKDQLDTFNDSLQRTLLAPSACGDVPDDVLGDVFNTPNSDDMNDGWGTHGTGGGVWLCAYGTTYFNAGATSQVVIAKNYATGAVPLNQYNYPGWIRNSSDGKSIREDLAYNTAPSVATSTGRTGGNDLHADTGSSGSVIIKNESGYPGWIDENASTSRQVSYDLPVSEGRVNIVNNGAAQTMPAANIHVEVSGNISRRGGGLAANGTFMFGMRDDQANVESVVDLKKAWHATAEKKPVSIRVSAVQGNNTAIIADVPLDGEANAPKSEYDAVEELAPTGSAWNGRFKLPIELNGSEGKIKVFTLILKEEYRKDGDTDGVIDPTTLQGRAKLAEAIKSIKEKHKDPDSGEIDEEAAIEEINSAISIRFSDNLKLSCKEYEMVDGQPVGSSSYVFTSKDVDLSAASFDLQSTSFYGEEYNDQTGQMEPVEIYQVHVFGIELALSAQNDNNPITEKYVNKGVHSDIINFDQDFEYDIMAYVPLTAEEFTISDTLVNGLEFAGPAGNANTNANQVVRSIAVKTLNNHKPGEEGSVSGPGEPGSSGNPINLKPGQRPVLPGGKTVNVNTQLSISGKTLTVHVPAGDTLDLLKGKWVQVTFGARIEDKYRSLDALKDLSAGVDGKDKSWEGTDTVKKGDPAYEYLVANGDKAIVAPILAEVGPDPVIWAVEAPSRLFARTANGDYYATPMNDKTGDTWQRLEKNLDDGKDDGYGKPVWINADNRYYGRAPHASNTVNQLGMEDSKLNSLKGMPLVVGSEVTKAAEGATRYFAEVKDAEGGVHIWATDKGELDSLTWHEVTDTTSDEYVQAQGRLSNDRYTIRMLDLTSDTVTLDPNAETGKNWPVISAEEHEGMVNQGSYSVRFGNNAEAKTYKTNTVTVAPETTELVVEKVWAPDDQWPEDVKNVIFNIYSKKGDEEKQVYVGTKPLTVMLTKNESKTTVSGLPKLKGTYYIAREEKITTTSSEGEAVQDASGSMSARLEDDRFRGIAAYKPIRGYAVAEGADEGRLFAITLDGDYWTRGPGEDAEWEKLNKPAADAEDKLYDQADEIFKANGEDVFDLIEIYTATNTTPSAESYVDVEITKKWENVTLDEIPSAEGFQSFLILKNGNEDVTETYKDKLTVTAKGTTYTARWKDLPEGAYTVEEKEVPGFETEISDDGKTITNTKKPEEEKPEIEKFVNEAVHKEIDLTEEFTYDIVAYVTQDADHVKITDTLNDMLTFATDVSGVAVVDLADEWGKNNHKVTNSIENVKVNEDATVALNRTPIDDAKVEIDGKTLTVTIENKLKPVYEETEEEITSEETEKTIIGYEYDGEEQPVKALRGHWIRITFKAKIEKDKALEEIAEAYQTINADEEEKDRAKENVGNAPVLSAENHRGIPNMAGYSIGVANEAGIQYDTYSDESNTVTVKPKEESVDIAVAKQWDHGSNKDLPASVTIRLLADETEIASMTLDETNQWEGSFSGLAKYKDPETRKNRITYTITEDPVEGYTTAVTGTAEDGFVVTNTFVEEEPGDSEGEGQFTVEKIVGEGVSGTRAYEIRVTMTSESGEVSSETVRLRPGDEPCLFEHIKSGTNVAIEEITTGFKTTYTVDDEETQEFTIQTGDDVRVVVLNEKQEVKPSDEPDKSKKKATPTATPQKKKANATVAPRKVKANATAAPQRGKAAKTGDESNVILWISLMAAAVLTLTGVLRKAGK